MAVAPGARVDLGEQSGVHHRVQVVGERCHGAAVVAHGVARRRGRSAKRLPSQSRCGRGRRGSAGRAATGSARRGPTRTAPSPGRCRRARRPGRGRRGAAPPGSRRRPCPRGRRSRRRCWSRCAAGSPVGGSDGHRARKVADSFGGSRSTSSPSSSGHGSSVRSKQSLRAENVGLRRRRVALYLMYERPWVDPTLPRWRVEREVEQHEVGERRRPLGERGVVGELGQGQERRQVLLVVGVGVPLAEPVDGLLVEPGGEGGGGRGRRARSPLRPVAVNRSSGRAWPARYSHGVEDQPVVLRPVPAARRTRRSADRGR